MTKWIRRILITATPGSLAVVGCIAPAPLAPMASAPMLPRPMIAQAKKPTPVAPPAASLGPILQAQAQVPAPPSSPTAAPRPVEEPRRATPAYSRLEILPIDLPTVIQLVDANSPAIGFARSKVGEANARLALAKLQWLPNLSAGTVYTRFDGQTQNQAGNVFGVSRANLFSGGGATLSLDLAEALYRPLIERRMTNAEAFRHQAVTIGAELDAVTAYLDLVQAHGQLEINAETLKKAEAMLAAAQNAKDAKLDRSAGDVNRAQTEVLLRRVERAELEGRAGAASARLGRLLLLQPQVKLVPAELRIVPLTLIDPASTLDDLVGQAINNRPDLAANREAIAAAWARLKRQERGLFFPKVAVANQTGTFGGGLNDDLQKFSARNALSLQMYWEVKNLGLGNRAEATERRALLEQSHLQLVEAQARVAADLVEAAQIATARYEALEIAERAVKEATELYRINKEGTQNVVDAKNLFDALRPLQAIQVLNQAQTSYLSAVMDFNRAQYRLLTALGGPVPR